VTTHVNEELPHVNLRIVTPGGQELAQWGRGIRTKLRSEVDTKVATCSDERWGTLSGRGERPSSFGYPLRRDLHWELELCAESTSDPTGSGAHAYLEGLLEELAGDAGPALADLAFGEVQGPIASRAPESPEGLRGWHVVEVWLLTSVSPITSAERVPWCRRPARILYSEQALITAWHPFTVCHDWTPDPGKDLVAPLPVAHRRHSMLTRIPGQTGAAAAGRLVQDILQHHDWTRRQLQQRVERWERDFFGTARSGQIFENIAAEPLGLRLDEVHRLLAELRSVNGDLLRRAQLGWVPRPTVHRIDDGPGSLPDEIRLRTERADDEINRLNGSLREGWTLLASAATGAQVSLQRQAQELQEQARAAQREAAEAQRVAEVTQQRFQNAAALIAALVLVPGVIVGLYSASVTGLPGMGTSNGLIAIGAYATLGASITLTGLQALRDDRRRRAAAVLGVGVVLYVVLSLILQAVL
jgi:Mg2+ and Co2+ transporter CorA